MSTAGWHVAEEDLRRYVDGGSAPPLLWSVEAHLAACGHCRAVLADLAGPELTRAGWARLDAELDAPVPSPVERLMLRFGVADHTARLLAATPALRLSWLAAVALTLALTTALANLMEPVVFLAVAPLLPLAGVAVSFGPRVDPTYEMALVAPMHTFRLLLLRSVAVLGATTALSALASLALPDYGLAALGWFVPALAVTLCSLALSARVGPTVAAGSVGAGWLALVLSSLGLGSGGALIFGPPGQLAMAGTAALAGVVMVRLRPAFETWFGR